MDDKIKILLDKINIDETSYQYFNDAKITKIKVNSKTNSWNIFIDKDSTTITFTLDTTWKNNCSKYYKN